jgi:hypothetical protein
MHHIVQIIIIIIIFSHLCMLKLIATVTSDGVDHMLIICPSKLNLGYTAVSYSVTQYVIGVACNKMCRCLSEHVNMYDIQGSLTCN